MPWFQQSDTQKKADGSIITQADLAVQTALKTELDVHYPQYGFFAEELSSSEMTDFFSENQTGYWCLDPLDGTSNFATGLPFFAISLALIVEQEPVLGVVYDPVRDECFSAIKNKGAYLNGKALNSHESHRAINDCLAMIDLKRLPTKLLTKLLTDPPYASQRSFGAAALEWCWLAAGRSQLYLHGKHMLWDYAAGLLIAHEAGCVSSDLLGQDVFQPSLEAKKVLAAVDNSLYKQWFDFICR